MGDRLFIHRTTVSVDQVSGDSRRSVEEIERSAIIPYAAIRKCVKIEADPESPTPWEDCDGWEHHTLTQDAFETKVYETTHVNHKWGNDDYCRARYRAMREQFKAGCGYYCTDRGDRKWIVLDYDVSENEAYMRHRGCSKQVAKELAAEQKRQSIRLLVKWYENGWESWYVTGEFRNHESHIGTFNDYEEAKSEGIPAAIGELIDGLESDGYIISEAPPEPTRFKNGYTLEGWKTKLTTQLAMFNVTTR